MKNVLLSSATAALLICLPCFAVEGYAGGFPPTPGARTSAVVRYDGPNFGGLRLVAQLPPELPQRVTGFAYDGEKFWAAVYHGRGRYATLNPSTLGWEISHTDKHHKAIMEVSGAFASPGGIVFDGSKLWVGGAYGESLGCIDTQKWDVTHLYKGRYREHRASQSYSGLAFDGSYLWVAWHWTNYRIPAARTQLLLKLDPETGKVAAEYPLPPGKSTDMTHGLTWDGTRLWHMKDNKLSSIDPADGRVSARYVVPQIKRASGLAWDGSSLWIAEFDGKVWRLPF